MNPVILVKVLMNSSAEDVLGWKCCNIQDMNLEVQVYNTGKERVKIKNVIELAGKNRGDRVDYLFPPGVHALNPGEGMSFYCSFDEQRFKDFSHIIIEDANGKRCRAAITGDKERAKPED